jgi:hypothetical protein
MVGMMDCGVCGGRHHIDGRHILAAKSASPDQQPTHPARTEAPAVGAGKEGVVEWVKESGTTPQKALGKH